MIHGYRGAGRRPMTGGGGCRPHGIKKTTRRLPPTPEELEAARAAERAQAAQKAQEAQRRAIRTPEDIWAANKAFIEYIPPAVGDIIEAPLPYKVRILPVEGELRYKVYLTIKLVGEYPDPPERVINENLEGMWVFLGVRSIRYLARHYSQLVQEALTDGQVRDIEGLELPIEITGIRHTGQSAYAEFITGE